MTLNMNGKVTRLKLWVGRVTFSLDDYNFATDKLNYLLASEMENSIGAFAGELSNYLQVVSQLKSGLTTTFEIDKT